MPSTRGQQKERLSAAALRRKLADVEMLQVELAEALNVTPVTVNRWACGIYPIPHLMVFAIEDAIRQHRRPKKRA